MLVFGIVTEIFSQSGTARVRFPDLDNFVSEPLPVSVAKSLDDKFSIPFDVNEQVWCLFTEDMSGGIIGGAIYSTKDVPVPGVAAGNVHIAFAYGLSIDYNRNSKTLSVTGTGKVSVDITGDANIKSTNAKVEASAKVTLKAPLVEIDAATVNVSGLLNVSGVMTAGGIATSTPSGGSTGDATITGKLQIAGDIIATGEVKSGTISLKTHKHTGVTTGGGVSGTPTP